MISLFLNTVLTVRHILIDVREWPFAADAHAADGYGRGLSVTEYIAIGVCSILLGLIYVASVFLYLHVRRRRRVKQRDHCNGQPVHLAGPEDGVVKSNPLLSTKRHPLETGSYLSDSASCCSETDAVSDIAPTSDDSNRVPQNVSAHILQDISHLNGKGTLTFSTP
jgi:hypothetical protein